MAVWQNEMAGYASLAYILWNTLKSFIYTVCQFGSRCRYRYSSQFPFPCSPVNTFGFPHCSTSNSFLHAIIILYNLSYVFKFQIIYGSWRYVWRESLRHFSAGVLCASAPICTCDRLLQCSSNSLDCVGLGARRSATTTQDREPAWRWCTELTIKWMQAYYLAMFNHQERFKIHVIVAATQ